jgi:hypothetical protein
VRQIPRHLPHFTGTGHNQDLVTPTQVIHSNPDSTGLRIMPMVGNRSTRASVSQWQLDTPVTGQPASYVFLCAMLFLRDVDFNGSSIDAQSGGFVAVSAAERNLPDDIWEDYRACCLVTSPKDAKHWLMLHENHVCSHIRHYRQQSGVPTATLPGNFTLSGLPEAYLDHFRQGHWRTYLDRNKCPSVQYFHAFAFLHPLPYHKTVELFFPACGVPFLDALQVLTGIYCFLHLPLCKTASEDPDILCRAPLLYGIHTLPLSSLGMRTQQIPLLHYGTKILQPVSSPSSFGSYRMSARCLTSFTLWSGHYTEMHLSLQHSNIAPNHTRVTVR